MQRNSNAPLDCLVAPSADDVLTDANKAGVDSKGEDRGAQRML